MGGLHGSCYEHGTKHETPTACCIAYGGLHRATRGQQQQCDKDGAPYRALPSTERAASRPMTHESLTWHEPCPMCTGVRCLVSTCHVRRRRRPRCADAVAVACECARTCSTTLSTQLLI